jgi:mandelate racemase
LSSHLYPEVSVHLLAASPTAHWLEYVDWAAPIVVDPVRVVDGYVSPPERAGNGLAWNTDAVERYRVG